MFRQILLAGVTGGVIAFVLSAMQNAVLPAGALAGWYGVPFRPSTRRSVCLTRRFSVGSSSRGDLQAFTCSIPGLRRSLAFKGPCNNAANCCLGSE